MLRPFPHVPKIPDTHRERHRPEKERGNPTAFSSCNTSRFPPNKENAPKPYGSGALKTRYHPVSAGFPALGAADNDASRSALLLFRRKTPGPVLPGSPHRLAANAGSLKAGCQGFFPISVDNGFILRTNRRFVKSSYRPQQAKPFQIRPVFPDCRCISPGSRQRCRCPGPPGSWPSVRCRTRDCGAPPAAGPAPRPP